MNREDIIRMAQEAGVYTAHTELTLMAGLERFAALVAAAERNKLAQWMIDRGYATGHGDTTEDLLQELEWQVREAEREECARVCDELHPGLATRRAAEIIRARGETK